MSLSFIVHFPTHNCLQLHRTDFPLSPLFNTVGLASVVKMLHFCKELMHCTQLVTKDGTKTLPLPAGNAVELDGQETPIRYSHIFHCIYVPYPHVFS